MSHEKVVEKLLIPADGKVHVLDSRGKILGVAGATESGIEIWVEDSHLAAERRARVRVFFDGDLIPGEARHIGSSVVPIKGKATSVHLYKLDRSKSTEGESEVDEIYPGSREQKQARPHAGQGFQSPQLRPARPR